MELGTVYTCGDRANGNPGVPGEAFHFFPVKVADMNVTGSTYTYTEGTCFKNIKWTYLTDVDSTGAISSVTVMIDASRPSSLFCKDWFFIGNEEMTHVETITAAGVHNVTFTGFDQNT